MELDIDLTARQEARELAEHTAHYYDRGYIRREKYRI